MRVRGIVFRAVCLGLLLAFAVAAAASAETTLGLTTQASGATAATCASAPAPTLVQSTQDSTTPYSAPTDGVITQWQTDTTGDTPGATITFAVVRADMGGGYTVVGADTEAIPNPLPVSGVATFTLTTPIAVHSGDTLALYSSSAGVHCYSYGGSIPAGDNVVALQDAAPPPAAGDALTTSAPCMFCTLDVAASFSPTEDAGVTTSVGPSNAMAGSQALLSSTVSNRAGDPGPIRFTDALPTGLTINAVAAGQGTCATSGQIVTCTITGLASGQGAPVDVVVTPTAAGTYANSVTVAVSSSDSDPNSVNDTASATLAVRALPPASVAKCVVPKLGRIKLPFAKQVVRLLGCAVGKVHNVHSKSIHKGLVIRSNPGHGTYANGAKIAFTVSSGPPGKHHK
jgi:Domain of unknown function DUF11